MENPKFGTPVKSQRVERACNWLELSEHGLEAVRVLFNYEVGKGQFQILLVLEEMGLLRFLREAWVCQDWKVCQEFVDHWDYKSRTTTVHGTEIHASYTKFLAVTGLDREGSTEALDRPKLSSAATRCAALFGVQGDDWTSAPITSCTDSLIRDLLMLLNKTLCFASSNQPVRAPRDLIYRLLEALDGSQLSWGKFVHDNFVAEMSRLQILRRSYADQIRTQAGPLMYFLYARSRRKAAASSDIVQYNTTESMTEISNQCSDKTLILNRRESPTDEGRKAMESLSVASVQAPMELTLSCLSSRSNKKRRYEKLVGSNDLPCKSSTPLDSSAEVRKLENIIAHQNEEILRLQLSEIESRLKAEKMERLYLEEQKHVQQCLKLHFASYDAEEEIADLRAKVNALQDQKRDFEKRESFLELQLADVRRRWETTIVRAELAEIQAAEKSCLLLRLLPQTGS